MLGTALRLMIWVNQKNFSPETRLKLVIYNTSLTKVHGGLLKNSTVNADGGNRFANGEVDQFGAIESSSMGSGTFRNAIWKSDPSQVFWKLWSSN